MTKAHLIHYVQTRLDGLSITQSLVDWAFPSHTFIPSEQDQAVLAALRHSNQYLVDASLEEIQHHLQRFDEDRIVQVVSQIKKVLHEICLIRLNNQDGDSLYASYFEPKTQDVFEVLLADTATGESSKIQINTGTATAPKLNGWRKNLEDHLIAGEELITQVPIDESPLNSKHLSQSVEDAMDLLVTAQDPNDEHFWDYFPAISLASVSIAIYDLFHRYQKKQITWSEFKWMAAKVSGIKVSKIAFIGLLLGLPVVGQVTGAYLVAKLLLNAKATWFEPDSPLSLRFNQKESGKSHIDPT